MKEIPHFLTGLTAFIDGKGILGTVKSVQLPKVEENRETVKQGGFETTIGIGTYKIGECVIKLSEYNELAYNAWSEFIPIVIKGSIKAQGKNYNILVTIKGDREIDDGTLETGKEVERTIKVYPVLYSMVVNNVPQVLFDKENGIAQVLGKDHLADMRSHIL